MSSAWSDAHGSGEMRIPIAVSARHAHLSEATLRGVFGEGFKLHVRKWLTQTGQFSAQETVSLVGPRGRIDDVRLMGPPRHHLSALRAQLPVARPVGELGQRRLQRAPLLGQGATTL